MSSETKTAKGRAFVGFRPKPDVARMMTRAEMGGMNASAICNLALREFLIRRGFARKKDATA